MFTKPIQRHSSVIDQYVDALWVFLGQERAKSINAPAVRNVQVTVFEVRESAIVGQRFRTRELRVVLQPLHRGVAATAISGGQVNEQRPIVEGRSGILQGEVAH